MTRQHLYLLLAVLLIAVLAACSPSATPITSPVAQTQQPAAATSTLPAEPTPAQAETPQAVTVEGRIVELEYPASMRLGDSDVVRLSLIPTQNGYTAQVENPDHTLQTHPVTIPRPPGYDLFAAARLEGVGFQIEPAVEESHLLPPGEEVSWRWSLSPRGPGKHSLAVQLFLRWQPASDSSLPRRESLAYGRGIELEVTSFLGFNPSQAGVVGAAGLLLGLGLCLFGLVGVRGRPAGARGAVQALGSMQVGEPSGSLAVETLPGMALSKEEEGLLKTLLGSYSRVIIEREFLSGYSGARTLLVKPVRPDGRADAASIVKLGERESIRREWANYEDFVQHRLPPVTARIQRPPVTLKNSRRAGVQYTFIAEPGRLPVSLRQALLNSPDPDLLLRLFETFGPSWWMQRRAYTFRLGQEYDRLLPPHLVLAPVLEGRARRQIGPASSPAELNASVGELVSLLPFEQVENRADGKSLSLVGNALPGKPAVRVRWLDLHPPRRQLAKIVATRSGLLRELVGDLDLLGLPDPLDSLDGFLEEMVSGTCSVIHGDLNLENALVGPGNLIWLIDFAQTREGHPLFDFSHLESQIIAHILAPRLGSAAAFLDLWRSGSDPLLQEVHQIAGRCLYDPARKREYVLALYMACLGALKYGNLNPLARQCLLITAAELADKAIIC